MLNPCNVIRDWARTAWQSAFVRNVVVLMSGTALAQALQFAVSPILSRLYDPSAFGLLGVFLATKGIISVAAAAKYDLSIVIPEKDEMAANLFALGSGIVLIVALLVLGGVVVGRSELATLIGEPDLAPYLWWLPLAILAAGLYQVFNYWATRKKHFTRLSLSQGVRAVGVAGTQVPAGYFRAGTTGLIGGRIAGEVLATLTLGIQILREDWRKIRGMVKLSKMKQGAVAYKKFPTYTAPQNFINSVSQNAPTYLLVLFFDPATVGYYWFTRRILRASSRLIGKAVRKVFYQRASEKYNKGDGLEGILKKVTGALFAISFIPLFFIFIFGPDIFEFLFGNEWRKAGIFCRWMSVWTLFQFSNIPSVMSIHITGKQKYLLIFEVVLFMGRVISIPLGSHIGNDVTAIVIFSSVGAVFNMLLIFSVFNMSDIK